MGRTFVTGASGFIGGANVAHIQSQWDAFEAALIGTGDVTQFVVLHSQVGAIAPPVPTPITSFVLETQLATQRRRMRR